MAGVMESLAMGLRGAGGILSPTAFKAGVEEDAAQAAERRKVELMQMQEQMAAAKEKMLSEAVAPSLLEGNFEKAAAAAANSGAPGGTKLAMELLSKSEERKARVLQAADALALRRTALDQAHEEKLARLSNDAERAAETQRHNTVLEVYKARELEMNNALKRMGYDLQTERNDRQNQAQLNTQVQRLGGALEKANLPQADAVLADVENEINKNPDVLKLVTGIGEGTPDWMLPKAATDARQAFTKLFNITLKDRSGSAVTNQELERLKKEFGSGLFKKPEQLQTAVDKARDIINKHYAAVAAGYGPDALKAYNENLRGFGGRVVLDPKGGSGWTVEEVK